MSQPPPTPLPPAPPIRRYVCRRAPFPPAELDGRLDKAFWAGAVWTDDFVDIEGELRPRPRWRTRVKMLWDDSCFYFGCEMEEPHLWATLTERESVIFHDNDFEIFLNPTCDRLNYYEFEMNALNTVWDLFLARPYRDGGQADNGWDIGGLRTAVHLDGTLNDPSDVDRGWSVEVAIPFAAFDRHSDGARPPRPGEVWKVNFSRVEWDLRVEDGRYVKIPGRPEHNWVWSPMGLVDMHLPERWGEVEFGGK
ncbi:MAG: carbohydrate-binding family 9-like protein [Phycisphaeraceae bacterium]|nr:carbohydrate-binding family 9-like protein [Phycisphaeraceae bacterium]